MGREKPQVRRVGIYGRICCRLGERSFTLSPPQHPVPPPLNLMPGLMDDSTQPSRGRDMAFADNVSKAAEPLPKVLGGRISIFNPRHPVNLGVGQPLPKKSKAAKMAAERDAKALKIDGNEKLDLRKSRPTAVDLETATDRRAMLTRGSLKTTGSGSGEIARSGPSIPQMRAKRRAAEAGLSQTMTEAPLAQDASNAAPSRHDSVATGSEGLDDDEAIQTPNNGLSSSLFTMPTANGTKRRKVLPDTDEVIERSLFDDEGSGASTNTHPSHHSGLNIANNAVGSYAIANEDGTIPGSLSAAEGREETPATTAATSRPAKRKRNFGKELEISGTTALGRTTTADADRYRKSYKAANGRWYSWSGTEKPDWAVDERDDDLGGRTDEYTATSSRGRPRRDSSYRG